MTARLSREKKDQNDRILEYGLRPAIDTKTPEALIHDPDLMKGPPLDINGKRHAPLEGHRVVAPEVFSPDETFISLLLKLQVSTP